MLLDSLKTQHRQLEKLVGVLNGDFARSDGAAISKDMQEFKAFLMGHLELEDTKLYPELRKAGAGNPQLLATVDRFSTSMVKIGETLRAFLGKAESKGVNVTELAAEWKGVALALTARVTAEEGTLYSLFEKHCAGK
jgi:hypothetical protein